MRIEQIDNLQRPLTMEDGGVVLMDLLWSDPTTNDGVEGVQPSPRGPGLVTFGPDRVKEFCKVGLFCLATHQQLTTVMLAVRERRCGFIAAWHGMSVASCWYPPLHDGTRNHCRGPYAICRYASQYPSPSPLSPPPTTHHHSLRHTPPLSPAKSWLICWSSWFNPLHHSSVDTSRRI